MKRACHDDDKQEDGRAAKRKAFDPAVNQPRQPRIFHLNDLLNGNDSNDLDHDSCRRAALEAIENHLRSLAAAPHIEAASKMINALFDASYPETRLLAASTNPIRLAAFVLWTLTRFLEASPPSVPNPSLPSTNTLAKSVARVLESQAATSSQDVKDNMDAVNAVYADLQRVVTAICQVLQSYSALHAGLQSAMRDSEFEVASRKSMGNAFKIARRLVDCLMCEATGIPSDSATNASSASINSQLVLIELKKDLQRYSWMLFLFWKGNDTHDAQTEANIACMFVLYCLANAPSEARRTLRAALTILEINSDHLSPETANQDWLHVFPLLISAMTTFFENSKVSWFNAQQMFHDWDPVLRVIKAGNFSPGGREGVAVEGIGAPVFPGCLGHKGALSVNLDTLNGRYETFLDSEHVEFDYRLFLPAYRMMATARKRSVLAPNPTTQSGTRAIARSLKTIFQKTSTFNSLMQATPITARSAMRGVITNPEDEQKSFKERINERVAHLAPDQRRSERLLVTLFMKHGMNATLGAKCFEKARNFADSLKSIESSHARVWDLIVPLYAIFVESTPPSEFDLTCEHKRKLMNDEHFHRALLFCSFEFLRFAHNVPNTISYEGIMQLINVRYIEVCVVIDVLIKFESWISLAMIKRLKEIQEKILESELWKEDLMYEMMADYVNLRVGSSNFTDTMQVYTALTDPTNKWQSHIASDSAFDPFKGFQTVLVKITRMMQSRVQELCNQAKLGDDVSAKACQLIEALLNVEVHNRLLCKRHTDVVMISAVYATAKLAKLPISFNHLLASYLKQPQASQAIMLGVYTGEGQEKIDVVKYYNTIFVQHANKFLFGGEGLAAVPGGIEIFSPLKFRTEPVAPHHTATSVTRQTAINVGQGRTGRSMGSSRQLFSTRTPSSLKTTTTGTVE